MGLQTVANHKNTKGNSVTGSLLAPQSHMLPKNNESNRCNYPTMTRALSVTACLTWQTKGFTSHRLILQEDRNPCGSAFCLHSAIRLAILCACKSHSNAPTRKRALLPLTIIYSRSDHRRCVPSQSHVSNWSAPSKPFMEVVHQGEYSFRLTKHTYPSAVTSKDPLASQHYSTVAVVNGNDGLPKVVL